MRFALVSALGLLLAAPAARADDQPPPDQRLKALQDQMSKSEADRQRLAAQGAQIQQQLDINRRDMVAMAALLQDRQLALADIEKRIATLGAREAERRHALELRRDQLKEVLVAIQRLAFQPSEAMVAMPLTPSDMVRSAILLRDVTPRLKQDAAELRTGIDQIAALQSSITDEEKKATVAAAAIADQRQQLAALFSKTQTLAQSNQAEQKAAQTRLSALASQASSLQDLLARLEREKQLAEQQRLAAAAAATPPSKPTPPIEAPMPSFVSAKGTLVEPAPGDVAAQFGAPDGFGSTLKGIDIATPPAAQVVAPFAGKVVFAGPFRNYGLLLIIEHSEGYHTLLSGLARIDSSVGQQVLTGEPVGTMGDNQAKPMLYVEIRNGGTPVDPMPWLSARKTKVAG